MRDSALFRSANHWLSDERFIWATSEKANSKNERMSVSDPGEKIEWGADSEPRKNERVPSSGFCRMFAWSQLDFSAIPVSISAVSLTGRQTWQNVISKGRLQRIQIVQEGKRHQRRESSTCFCLCSFCFWKEVSSSWILNDIGRNFLLGSRKKIAKCLMRTFTCRSTFLFFGLLLIRLFWTGILLVRLISFCVFS